MASSVVLIWIILVGLFCLLLFGFLFQSSLQSSNWEDAVSTASSLSGAEEKVFKAACEQMNMNSLNCGHSGDNLVCITWRLKLAFMSIYLFLILPCKLV